MSPACFHCGLPVTVPGRWRAPVLGEAREFCCGGCRAVAETIAGGGFARYYETRAALPAQPPAQPGESCALYDEPGALREFAARAADVEGALEATFLIEHVRCAACLWLVEQALRRQPGVVRADVNFATHRAQVTWDPRLTRPSALIGALHALGYGAQPFDPRRRRDTEQARRRAELWRLFVAGFGAMQVMMYAFPAYLDEGTGTLSRESGSLMRWASLLLTLPVILIACGPFFSGAWRELKRLRPGMDTPIALGIAAGFAASVWATVTGEGPVYFDSISMLVFLLLGARWLEAAARERSTRSLDRLARWIPDFALRLDAGAAVRVAASELAPGDRVLVAAGERVPADGVVETGYSSVDESLLTGESRPIACGPGAFLTGGSTNLEQPLVMKVERSGAETRAAAIARLVERGAASRPRLVADADAVAAVLIYVVLGVALLAGLYWQSLWIAAAVLVVVCPCALALAAPMALASAAGQFARHGVALAKSSAIETLAHATDVVLDKTGTLTEGRFSIAGVDILGAMGERDCLLLARRLEQGSRHPLARAFGSEAATVPAERLREYPGRGIEGWAAGRRIRIGTRAFCSEIVPGRAPAHAADMFTRVYLADEAGCLAIFSLRDALRPGSARAVEGLKAAGLRVHLLSGDNPSAVEAAAQALGIEKAFGGLNPEDKLAFVENLQNQGRIVVMVGDGINDAPVLARADVSVAMSGGADLAQRQADLLLLASSVEPIVDAFGVARHTMRIVRQNFAWAIAYNVLALPAAALGWIGPWEAAVGMAASSLIVVLNGLRLEQARVTESSWKASTSSSPSPSRSYS